MPMACTASLAGRACSRASAPRLTRSKATAPSGQARRCDRADLRRAAGHRHGRDRPDHLGAQVPQLGQRGGGDDRRALLGLQHRRVHRPYRAGGAGRRADRQSAGWRPDPDHDRPQPIDRQRSTWSAEGETSYSPEQGAAVLAARSPRPTRSGPALPDDTRLWAALQQAGGGTWGGCVYDVEAIIELLEAGRQALGR